MIRYSHLFFQFVSLEFFMGGGGEGDQTNCVGKDDWGEEEV